MDLVQLDREDERYQRVQEVEGVVHVQQSGEGVARVQQTARAALPRGAALCGSVPTILINYICHEMTQLVAP